MCTLQWVVKEKLDGNVFSVEQEMDLSMDMSVAHTVVNPAITLLSKRNVLFQFILLMVTDPYQAQKKINTTMGFSSVSCKRTVYPIFFRRVYKTHVFPFIYLCVSWQFQEQVQSLTINHKFIRKSVSTDSLGKSCGGGNPSNMFCV